MDHIPDPSAAATFMKAALYSSTRTEIKMVSELTNGVPMNTMPDSRHHTNLMQAYKIKVQTNNMLFGILNSKTT